MEVKNITKYGLGTFTYREKPRVGYKIAGIIAAYSIIFYIAFKLVSPVIPVAIAHAPTGEFNKPAVTLPQDTQSVQIENYIRQVFGKYSDKAFQLLTDPRCHENGSLNPLAINDNRTWGGVGEDVGIMQINTVYQDVSVRYLENWKVNILIGYQIFKASGYRFNLWTCGRALGI